MYKRLNRHIIKERIQTGSKKNKQNEQKKTKQNSQQAYEKVLNDISHQKNEIKTSLRYTYCRRAKIKKKKKRH